jgi:molecular chaperone HtpG
MVHGTVEKKTIDFLTPKTRQIRHQIRNVLDSYNHQWDILAELAQNSVDAIRVEKPIKGHIEAFIDAPNRELTFSDNGCGIPPASLPALLAPFSSGKSGSIDLIGNKGVGISFVIFSSANFVVESHHESGSIRAQISGASAWVNAENEELPQLTIEDIEPTGDHGTKIWLRLPEHSTYEFFELSFKQLEMVLRTRTALGDTNTIWGASPNKDFVLKFRDLNGAIHAEEIECRFFLPTERISRSASISLREFEEWNDGQKTDAQKRAKLKDKLVVHDGTYDKAGRKIRFWSCFVPKRKAWDIVSVQSGLIGADILDLNSIERMDKFGEEEYLFSGGMYTSTRGMPTGIRSEMKTKGSGGYLPNFFIVIDDPMLSFDIGRKSIPGRQLGMLRDAAAEAFRTFISSIRKYVGGEPEAEDDAWERGAVFSEIHALPSMNSKSTSFLKRPFNQEASVAAIFFELIGRGVLTGFQPLISGYKNKYDLYAKYRNSDIVVEFKQSLGGLFSDFDDEAKLFDQINVVVIWDVTEQDRKIISSRGLDLQEIEEGLTSSPSESKFHFNLVLGPTTPIKVLCIRRLLEIS